MSTFTLSGRDTLIHQALLYGSAEEYAELAARCLHDGLVAGDAVVVAAVPEHADLLRERLGEEADRIEFVAARDWFRGPMHALGLLHDRARDDWWPRGRLRLLAETRPPQLPGSGTAGSGTAGSGDRAALEEREWSRVDSILNVLFAATPSIIVCAHDLRSAAPEAPTGPARTHPELLTMRGPRPSEHYVDPLDFYAECNAVPLPPPPTDRAVSRPFASGSLPGLREFMSEHLAKVGVPGEQTLRFVLAVNEVATNIIRHGGGRGSLWLWTEPDGPDEAGTGRPVEVVCDLTDPARRLDDRFLGYIPPRPYENGAGMWAVRRLCHIVEIRSGASGTVVRLHMRVS